MERIAAGGSRVIDKPNAEGGGRKIVIGIRVGCLSVGGAGSPATTIALHWSHGMSSTMVLVL
jgi:hypothetical protein